VLEIVEKFRRTDFVGDRFPTVAVSINRVPEGFEKPHGSEVSVIPDEDDQGASPFDIHIFLICTRNLFNPVP